jgi:ABC-type antimicrobial peptide transport system permease subunit
MENWRVSMNETFFPVNDLLRRKLQTGLAIITLTLSIASTLFLLLFSERIGFGIISVTENALTHGLSAIFSQFVLFVGILIFAVGAVITSFIIFLMMTQRTKDFGLIKAAGCPNGLVFGYFMTELLIVIFAGCFLGVVLGLAADFAATNMSGFQAYQKPPNFWLVPLAFGAFFALSLIFGTKPLLSAARLSPIRALSPVQYFGLSKGSKLKALSRSGISIRIASRSLFRRQSATVRIVLLLSIVFVLLTVSIAGSIIADDTTMSWVEEATGRNVIVVAHSSMCSQYKLLYSKFQGVMKDGNFDYADPDFFVSDAILQQLNVTAGIESVDTRLILKEHIQEVRSYTIDPETLTTIPVGEYREGDFLVIGVEPEKMVETGYMEGQFLNSSSAWEAIIGDTIAHTMFFTNKSVGPNSINPKTGTKYGNDYPRFSDPLLESVRIKGITFRITGVLLDPINNGNITYVSLKNLQNVTNVASVNIVLVKLDPSVDRAALLAQIKSKVQSVDSEFTVFELDEVLNENLAFLGSTWSTIMILPLFTLTSAVLCLIGYMMLAVDEQRQEFAILRAIGTNPKTTIVILATQGVIVLLSSFAAGIAFGVIATLMILVPNPVVTIVTILEIAAWLFAALTGMFLLSLYPAVKFAKTSLLKIMA